MSRKPWHAGNHCNVTFNEFVRREWSTGRWGQRGLLGAAPAAVLPQVRGRARASTDAVRERGRRAAGRRAGAAHLEGPPRAGALPGVARLPAATHRLGLG